jgi:GTP1/Obg family GTP-binding protein
VSKLDELAIAVLRAAEEECRTFALRDIRSVLRPLIERIEKVEADKNTLLCPVHASLDSRDKLKPFDNCIACIRNERDELRSKIHRLETIISYIEDVDPQAVAKAREAQEVNRVKAG